MNRYTNYDLFANYHYEPCATNSLNENPYELWRTFQGGTVKAESLDYLGVKVDSEGRFSPAELVRKLRWEDFTVDNLLEEGYIESEDELVRGITLGDYYYSVWQKRDDE